MAHRGNRKHRVTPELVETFRALHEAGETYAEIGRKFGFYQTTIRYHLNPELKEHRRRADNLRNERVRNGQRGSTRTMAVLAEEEWRKQLPKLPKGPTTLNQALLGDPLKGRSALDRMQNA
jgi:predicted transcriptional regulator